jgi:predicted acetyltransferase
MEMRPVSAEELPAFARAAETAFHDDLHPDDLATQVDRFEPERSLAIFDGPDIVATTAVFTRELTIPGATIPAACVSEVGVLATHRRRGLLTRLMRRQLDDVRARGEALAVLWASEPAIYGRYGYGIAAFSAEIRLRTAGTRLQPGAPTPAGRTRLLHPGDAVPEIAPLYDAVRRHRPGHLDRSPAWWAKRVHDPEHRRGGAGSLRAAVHEAPSGAVDGYALYAVRSAFEPEGPDGEVVVRELVADGPVAAASLWTYLTGLDLTRRVTWSIAPADEPLAFLLEGPARPVVQTFENLWVRLVDVGAALAARRYTAPVELVFDVEDAFCPWNTGRWRLEAGTGGATCERSDASADIALAASALGSAYLGGPTFAALAAAGRVRELHAGALAGADTAFGVSRAPWCPEIF